MKQDEQSANPFIRQVNRLFEDLSTKQQSREPVNPRITCTRLRRLREIRRELVLDPDTSSENELIHDSVSAEQVLLKQRSESFGDWVLRNQQAHKQLAEMKNQARDQAYNGAKDAKATKDANAIKDANQTMCGFANFSTAALQVVARGSNTPMSTLKWLAAHYRPEVRQALASNENAGIEIMTVLSRDSEDKVRFAVLDNASLPHDVLLRLCDDPSLLISEKAKNMFYEKTKFQLKENQVNGNKAGLAESVRNESVPTRNNPEKVKDQELKRVEREFLKVIAERSTTPPRRLAELAVHPDATIRATVANNPNCTPEIFWKLANDPLPEVRIKLFGNYNCPADIVEYLRETV